MSVRLFVGDCREVLAGLDADSIDACVTDPPYGLEFMGKEWDSFKTGRAAKYVSGGTINKERSVTRSGGKKLPIGPNYVSRPAKRCAKCGKQAWSGSPCRCDEPEWVMDNSPLHTLQAWHETWAREVYRVLKPGAHILAFGGTRTHHRLMVAIEDAGFEIRDCLMWLYGSGFPKSLDVSKALDKAAGAEREVVGTWKPTGTARIKGNGNSGHGYDHGELQDELPITAPVTDLARQWDGWGTALKPAYEPIILARKPLRGSVAANVTACGTGALNVDGCRIGNGGQLKWDKPRDMGYHGGTDNGTVDATASALGRWPANVILDEDAAALLDAQSGERPVSGSAKNGRPAQSVPGGYGGFPSSAQTFMPNDTGGASRFFTIVTSDCWLCDGPKHGIMNAIKNDWGDLCNPPAKSAELPSRPTSEHNDTAHAHAQASLLLGSEASNQSNKSDAGIVASPSTPGSEIIASTAQPNAATLPTEQLVQHVSDAGNLCERCTTAIAQSLANLSHSHELFAVGPAFIDGHRRQILSKSLALYAEILGSTDTIPTTASLKLWFGYVRDAMQRSIPTDATAIDLDQIRLRYESKSSRAERNKGLEGMVEGEPPASARSNPAPGRTSALGAPRANHHPTVKPVDLMQWLVRLVCPKGATVLDPFMGSGSTGIAADREGCHFIGIEQDPEYLEIARRRIVGDAPLFASVEVAPYARMSVSSKENGPSDAANILRPGTQPEED